MRNIKTIIFMAMLAGTITLSACGNTESLDINDSSSTSESTASPKAAEPSANAGTTAEKAETNAEIIVSDEAATTAEISVSTEAIPETAETSTENAVYVQSTTSAVVPESEPDTVIGTVPVVSSDSNVSSDNQNDNSAVDTINNQEYIDKANELKGALDYIDDIGASNIPFDESMVYTDENGNTFAKVYNTQFSNTADLREYMKSYMTDSFINERYSGILDTNDPKYIDVDGILYGKMAAKAGGFTWTNTPMKIENVTESSFNFLAEYDNYGTPETMCIDVVMDNGAWKINWVTFGL